MSGADHVMYLGHATNLIRIGGMRLLTDPIFGGILGVGKRYRPFPLDPAALGRLDGILLSHAHYDHLDTASLRKLSRQVPVIVPPHTAPFVSRLGYGDVRELGWWQSATIGAARITATPAAHWPGRLPWSRRTGYGGYMIEAADKTVFFAGDTGACREYPAIAARWQIDLAIIPIGAYNPDAFRVNHLSPEDALDAFVQLKARRMFPIHWGVFRLSREPMHEPPVRLERAANQRGLSQQVTVLQPGEQIAID
ncbi:MAG TPA: MBL fold metallo-hydrolase [Herpetosiphonaceae bacterium]|nr:MBL fold metallo-hydrolase [Herpetosiphonaceae bacterium]